MSDRSISLAEREAGVWHRHTLVQKLSRMALWLIIALAVSLSLSSIDVIWEFLWDAPEQMLDMGRRMWPPDLAYYPETVHDALMETFHIATLGTLFSMVLALPLSILAAHNITHNRWLNLFAKVMLVSSRSVNSLVWALLFVGVFVCPLNDLQISGGRITGDRLHHGFVMLLFGFHSVPCLLLFQMNQNRAFLKIDLPAVRAQADAQRFWPLLQLQKPLLCQHIEADACFSRA